MRYVAEYDDGARIVITFLIGVERTSDEAYRECARLLRERPTAHRVEAWDGGSSAADGGQYVTRATRGVEVAKGAQLALGMEDDHG